MLGTELAYVRQRLERCSREEQDAIARKIDVHPKTVRRITDKRTKAPRSDTVGKLALHFRTIEQRRRV